jgi:prepilin-type N-terminal cleavage/methylation domain-containing protein
MNRRGFTIVELLIVIVVIGILAAITIVAYNGIQQRAIATTLKADLTNARRQMELVKADGDTYPTTLPSAAKASQNVTLSLSQATEGYCINAQSTSNPTIQWSFNSSGGGLQEGLCSGAVISGSETGLNPNLVTDTGFSQLGTTVGKWYMARGASGSIAGTTRAGTSGDPYPSRPVLRISNVAASSTTFTYLAGPVDVSGITGGNTYLTRYYVRLASGTYTGAMLWFAVMSGSATNASINQNTSPIVPNSSWQLVSRTTTAVQNGVSGTFLYSSLSNNDTKVNDYTLEFQGFELRQQ